jgi:hypothetical protein
MAFMDGIKWVVAGFGHKGGGGKSNSSVFLL